MKPPPSDLYKIFGGNAYEACASKSDGILSKMMDDIVLKLGNIVVLKDSNPEVNVKSVKVGGENKKFKVITRSDDLSPLLVIDLPVGYDSIYGRERYVRLLSTFITTRSQLA